MGITHSLVADTTPCAGNPFQLTADALTKAVGLLLVALQIPTQPLLSCPGQKRSLVHSMKLAFYQGVFPMLTLQSLNRLDKVSELIMKELQKALECVESSDKHIRKFTCLSNLQLCILNEKRGNLKHNMEKCCRS